MNVEWLSNGELYQELILKLGEADYYRDRNYDLIEAMQPELERRLRLSGFFDMPLDFYLRELGVEFDLCYHTGQKAFECYSIGKDVVFLGKTALEAVKAAYEWKFKPEVGSRMWELKNKQK